jgi:hypothetical protein
MSVQRAIDYNAIRIALSRVVKQITGCETVLAEQKGQNVQPLPRPPLPYFTFKFLTPALKVGDDSREYTGTGNIFNSGGQRKMIVSFNCYAKSPEDAYELMTTLQASFDLRTVQATLRQSGIAHLTSGSVADLTLLLQTGYEPRSQMDVDFGIASNLIEDLGAIERVTGTGTVNADPNPAPVTDPFDSQS